MLARSREGDRLELWVAVTNELNRLEGELIRLLRPPWNGVTPAPSSRTEIVAAPVSTGTGADDADGRAATPRQKAAEHPRGADRGEVWRRIVAHAGQPGFSTLRGKPVVYRIEGDQVVVPRVTGGRIPRVHFEAALASAPLRALKDIPKECWGPSYILAILNDPRIRGDGLTTKGS